MLERRILKIFILIFLVFVFLIARMYYLQIYKGSRLSLAASAQRIDRLDLDWSRGDIVDRNLIPFTNRKPMYRAVLKPLLLRGRDAEMGKIAGILGLDFKKVQGEMAVKGSPVLVDIDREQRDKLQKSGINSVSVVNSLKRNDETTLAKHIIGYLNQKDFRGEAALEKAYDDTLGNELKCSVGVVYDAKNNPVKGLGYRFISYDGTGRTFKLKLTLDYHIQKIVEEVMEKNRVTGAVVVEDAGNGDIVAIASKPDYKPDNLEEYLDSPGNELFNRAVAAYNLGSIFKIIDVAVLYESNTEFSGEFFCNGSINVGGREMRCTSFKEGGHGHLNLKRAFASSCNPYFINMGIKLGYEEILKMAGEFGLGKSTGVRKQGIDESSGNLPASDRYYSKGDIANIAIGQGEILATPLQVADLVATVANGGIKNSINIVDSIVDDRGNIVRNISSRDSIRIISKSTADKIKEFMEEVTVNGTGRGVEETLDPYGGAAGKTGSAETGRYTGSQQEIHAWFGGYFPRNSPKYSIAVFVENGKLGGKAAAPIFTQIAEKIMKKGL